MSFNSKLINLLRTKLNLVDDEGDLLIASVQDKAWKIDHELIKVLLSDEEIKAKFFEEIDGYWIFNVNIFNDYISKKDFLNDSFSRFRNRIGLTINEKYLEERGEVSLVWKYKDGVLEGGQTKEEERRKEIFFNEILAEDEINRMFDPKVLTNFTRYTSAGKKTLQEFKRDDNGIIRENLIINGNNLIAMKTIEQQFWGQIKSIYIDPPYNLEGDSFEYNDSFNHASWLTFMKNRLEAARDLLRPDGAIFVQIDLHELGYLLVLMDEVFGIKNRIQVIAVKTASPAGFKTVNPGPIDVTEYILFYTKDRTQFNFTKNFVATDYDENYSLYIRNIEDEPENWELVSLRDIVYESSGIPVGKSVYESNSNAKEKWGEYWKVIRYQVMAKFALDNAERVVSVRDPHKPSTRLKKALLSSAKNKGKVIVFEKNTGDEEIEENERHQTYLYNGGALSFYSNKIQNVDGVETPTILMTDFWDDLSWAGIAKEGGVKLKNGKKPERLIKRIIEMSASKGDIVLDFFLGSGTTAAVAHKMGLQYIGIEQLDYGKNSAVVRLQKVIKGDNSGISKTVSWEGGGEFIYCELMKYNESFMEKIIDAKTCDELSRIWLDISNNSFLNWYINPEFPENAVNDFYAIGQEENGLAKQKKLLAKLLDKNQLYVNLSEINDEKFEVSEEDKKLNKAFFGEE